MFGTPDGRKLTTLRIIWLALLMGQVLFLVVATMVVRQPNATSVGEDLRRTLFMVDGGLLVLCGVVAVIVKLVTSASSSMQRYAAGTLVYLALFEGVSIISIVIYLLSRGWAAPLAIAAIAVFFQVVAFPRRALEV